MELMERSGFGLGELDDDVCKLDLLPREIWLQIFSFLPLEDVMTVVRVSKRCYGLANSNFLWTNLLQRDFEPQLSLSSTNCSMESRPFRRTKCEYVTITEHWQSVNGVSKPSKAVVVPDRLLESDQPKALYITQFASKPNQRTFVKLRVVSRDKWRERNIARNLTKFYAFYNGFIPLLFVLSGIPLACRLDGSIGWSWAAVFFPVWLQFALFFVVFGSVVLSYHLFSTVYKNLGAFGQFMRDDISCWPFRVNNMLSVILWMVFLFNLTAKLEGSTSSWFSVMSPIWVFAAMNTFTYTATSIVAKKFPTFSEKYLHIKHQYAFQIATTGAVVGIGILLTVIVTVLLCFKLEGTLHTSIWYILFPLWVFDLFALPASIVAIVVCKSEYGKRNETWDTLFFVVCVAGTVGGAALSEVLVCLNIEHNIRVSYHAVFLPVYLSGTALGISLIITFLRITDASFRGWERKNIRKGIW